MSVELIIIMMMYIYHALIGALSAHRIHFNLNTIFYSHVEDSATKTIDVKYYMVGGMGRMALMVHPITQFQ